MTDTVDGAAVLPDDTEFTPNLGELLMHLGEQVLKAKLAYNTDCQEFNQAQDQLVQLNDELAQCREEHTQAYQLANKQKQELAELVKLHQRQVGRADDAIKDLEGKLSNAQYELKKLQQLNPTRLEKQNKTLKTKNAELVKANEHLRKKNQELAESLKRTKLKLNGLVWSNGHESFGVMHFAEVAEGQRDNLLGRLPSVWWQHDAGVKLMVSYDPNSEGLLCADPRNQDGSWRLPSEAAMDEIEKFLKKVCKRK